MADWDADSPELHDNLARVLRRIRQGARRRDTPTVEDARHWQAETMQDLQVPDPKFVGAFRGELGLEDIQVRIAGRCGVAAPEVAAALADFEQLLQRVIRRRERAFAADAQINSRDPLIVVPGPRCIEIREELRTAAAHLISLHADAPRLTLVTCYPFDTVVPGGLLTFIVTGGSNGIMSPAN